MHSQSIGGLSVYATAYIVYTHPSKLKRFNELIEVNIYPPFKIETLQ